MNIFERVSFERIGFERGGDITKNIGIGKVKVLEMNLEKMKDMKAVERIHCKKTLEMTDRGWFEGVLLNLEVDLKDEHDKDVYQFLVKYLNPEFFEHVDVISHLGPTNMTMEELRDTLSWEDMELREKQRHKYTATMYVKSEYEKDFPLFSYPY